MFKITKAQVLHALSALVFVPVAAVGSAWLEKHFPGLPKFTPDQIAHQETVVAGSAFGLALHYLHGNLWFEKNVAPIADVVDTPAKTVVVAPSTNVTPVSVAPATTG